MSACPECSSAVQQIGEWSFCLDCEWDDLPRLADKKEAVRFGNGAVVQVIGEQRLTNVDVVRVEQVPNPDLSGLCYSLNRDDFPAHVRPFVDIQNYLIQSAVSRLIRFSPASGEGLEALGALYECDRNEGESDDDYRQRILEAFQGGFNYG